MPPSLVTSDLSVAVAVLAAGGLLGLPTETVYGLAADARSPRAVARVYALKGRPADHPLIVHVAGAADLEGWAARVPDYAHALAHRFWPGPLTLVLPRAAVAGDHVTGGLDSVGLRAPAHPVAQRVLRAFAAAVAEPAGLAAPSANRFGRVSPTTAQHVVDELGDLLVPGRDAVLDGGPSAVGVESTIVDCTGDAPALLRPGSVTASEIEQTAGVRLGAPTATARAPGTLAAHYAPSAEVVLAEAAAASCEVSADAPVGGAGGIDAPLVGLLAPADVPTPRGMVRLSAPRDAPAYAQVLYGALREADALGLRRVVAVPPPPDGVGAAVRDRLRRAETGSRRR